MTHETVRMLWVSGLVAVALGVVMGCQHNPYYSPDKPHHTEDGFQNSYPHDPHPGFWGVFTWKWGAFWAGVPEEPEAGYPHEVLKPDLEALHAKTLNPSVTWIGHATLLMQMGGRNVLTDPHFTERASPFSWAGPARKVPLPVTLEELPRIDLVVISHNHYDSLDVGTVEALNAQAGGPPLFLVPLGNKPWFEELEITNVREMDWWEVTEVDGLKVTFVPVQHWSARTRFDTNETLWGGWVIEEPDFRFFFAGDSGYSQDFRDIRARIGPMDFAAIPIGAYEPRWFMKTMHVNPEESVRIHQDVEARYSVAMHWGTFQLTDEPLDEPPKKLAEALDAAGIPRERFFVMKLGETRSIEPMLAADAAARGARSATAANR